jgi:tripeptide aminopeptidase
MTGSNMYRLVSYLVSPHQLREASAPGKDGAPSEVKAMINAARLKALLLELVKIDSLSKCERQVARRLQREMEELGSIVSFDDAGDKVGGDTGNLIAHVTGNAAAAPPLLLCAHMDTVVPGEGVRPIVEGDIIRSDGSTVLGGDDKSGIAIICEVVRTLKEQQVSHGDIDIVFTICEEFGLLGAKHLDVSRLRAQVGIVLDSDAVDFLFTRAPGANVMEFTVHGQEAHAGMAPERGISAIQVAAEAIAHMRLGRIDDETTANLGLISGGRAVNIVPNCVVVRGEARSHDEAKLEEQTAHMRACFERAAGQHALVAGGQRVAARVESRIERQYDRLHVPDSSRIVQLVVAAGERLGYSVRTAGMGGGCDANILNQRGLEVANLGTGMRDIHTVKEWLNVTEMVRSAEIVLEIVRLNAERGAV